MSGDNPDNGGGREPSVRNHHVDHHWRSRRLDRQQDHGTDARQGGLANIVIGVVGAVIGGFVARSIFGDSSSNNGFFASFLVALLGACIVIFAWKALSRRRVV